MAQLMPLPLTLSCFSKIQIGLTFLVPAHLGSPGKRAIKWVCVCGPKNWQSPFILQVNMCQILQGSVATRSMRGWSIINDFAGKQIIAESKQKRILKIGHSGQSCRQECIVVANSAAPRGQQLQVIETHTSSVAMPPLPTTTMRRAPDSFF